MFDICGRDAEQFAVCDDRSDLPPGRRMISLRSRTGMRPRYAGRASGDKPPFLTWELF